MTARAQETPTLALGDWLMLVALSVLWGGSFFFNAVAVKELPTFTVVVARVVLASAILAVVLRASGTSLPRGLPVWRAFFGMGLLNNVVPFSLIVWGQSHIASGVASILNATTPLFAVLVAHMLTRDERLTPARAGGVAVGFLGVVVLMGGTAAAALGTDVMAQAACLGAALSYAFSGVFGRRFRTLGVAPLATAWGQVTASSAMLLPLVLIVDRPWTLPMPGLPTVGALIAIASISTALAYVMFFRILARAGAVNVLLVTFLVPVSAILLGVVVLGEMLESQHVAGMALIGAGLAIMDGRAVAWARGRWRGSRAGSP